jgi:DNA-binding beta-propeller fold protein YncE
MPAQSRPAGAVARRAAQTTPSNAAVQHYEYVITDENLYVYDMDNGFRLVKTVSIPQARGVRGVVASPMLHALYISYGSDRTGEGNGNLLRYDLLSDQVLWRVTFPFGIDSMGILPDGTRIYMPDGENSSDGTWYVLDSADGKVIGQIAGPRAPHNTVVSLDGAYVYLDGRGSRFLEVASTADNTVKKKIGPLIDTLRPFTINGMQTLAYTTATGFLGFQVSDLNSSKVLYTVRVQGFSVPGGFRPSAPSHGISLSPDEKEIWLIDAANSYVHVFDVTGVPASAPKQVADLQLSRAMDGSESPCLYDCLRDGWIRHSRDGRFVIVGDSGDVFDAHTRKFQVNLDPLFNTRKFIEVDWQNGQPIFATQRYGVGYVTSPQ